MYRTIEMDHLSKIKNSNLFFLQFNVIFLMNTTASSKESWDSEIHPFLEHLAVIKGFSLIVRLKFYPNLSINT